MKANRGMGWASTWIVLGAAVWSVAGCSIRVVPTADPGTHYARRVGTTAIEVESFDPVPYSEDLLLIEPRISPPPVEVEAETVAGYDDDMAAEERPVESLDDQADAGDIGAARVIYRVQVMALKDSASAFEVAARVRQSVSASVDVTRKLELYKVRAGRFAERDAAIRLKGDIAALGGRFAEVYVVPEIVTDYTVGGDDRIADASAPPTETIPDRPPPTAAADSEALPLIDDEPIAPAPPDADLPEPERVRMPGWRVLILQFLDLGEAERTRKIARARLSRSDIDVIFESPYYKVLVGHYRTADEAKQAIEPIKRKGYRNALRVRQTVYLPRVSE